MKPLQTTPKEVLIDAIQSEVNSREMLRQLSERTEIPAVKKKLLELADKELMHRAKLERKYRDTIGENPPDPKPPAVHVAVDVIDLDMPKALKIVLDHERDSESNFRFLAERVPNTELGNLFLELAEIEWKHKVEIQREYDASLKDDPEQFFSNF